jgi:murein DD-endopeptidase MepM/ murein hydrolase activator NlpD
MTLKTPLEKEYPITQNWNDPRFRSSYNIFGLLGHNGIDYGVPTGTRIVAPHGGKIVENILDYTCYGWYVKIENDNEGSILGHFKEQSQCRVGTEVKQGDLVGLSGSTGNSTGPHLHWGYYRFPRKRDNGFSGTIDQTHWLGLETFEDEMLYERTEKEKYKKEARDLREVTQSQAESISAATKEIESYNQANAGLRSEIASLQVQFADVSRERDSLLSCCNDYEINVPKLTARIKELEEKLISQDPLKDFTAKDLWNALFDKLFKRR